MSNPAERIRARQGAVWDELLSTPRWRKRKRRRLEAEMVRLGGALWIVNHLGGPPQ